MKIPTPQFNTEHNHHFSSENPIETINDDEKGLNRNDYAKNLAINIKNYLKNNSDCITIGLMGDWGCGKTSLLNLTKLHLNESDIKIMEFNPWIYSSYNQLIEQFFDELISQFSKDSDSGLISELKSYKLKLNKSNLVKSIISTIISRGLPETGNILDENINKDSEETSLKKIKDNINEELKNHKIVCIIDDLDRLDSNEINEMFKLIKIMADFDNIAYIISFDKKIVSNAIKDNYGENFIEKIINVPLEVPAISQIELKTILRKSLHDFTKKYDLKHDLDRFEKMIDHRKYGDKTSHGILYFFKNIRDIKRFINLLEFNIELIKNEVNPLDFIGITAIQLFNPELYEKIKSNETLLVRYNYLIKDYQSNPEICREEQKEFEFITENDENIKHILEQLFPKMIFIYSTDYPLHYPHYDGELRICHKNHFKTYFKLSPILKEITEFEITSTINLIDSENEEALITRFIDFYEMDKLNFLFESLKNRTDKINSKEFFLKFILSLDKKLDEKIFNETRFTLKKICLMLSREINSNGRFEILKEGYDNSNHLNFLFELIIHIERHNFISAWETNEILTKTQIDKLKKLIKDKFRIMLNSYPKYINDDLVRMLDLGLTLELDSEVNDFIHKSISTTEGLLMFLESFISSDSKEFSEYEIAKLDTITNLNPIKEKIDENYEEIKNEIIVEKFLKGYKLWLDDNLEEI